MKKRILSALLALCMVLALLPGTAFAADTSGSCGDNVTWSYSNGTLTIQGTGAMRGYQTQEPWYNYRDEIKTVVVGEGVTGLGRRAFWYCRELTSVTLPSTLTTIGEQAFSQCRTLPSLVIPNGVTTIGPSAFYACNKLDGLTIPDSVTKIGRDAFGYCYSLTSITIPRSITAIDELAFMECQGLVSVTIPDSVTSIGAYAFSDCYSLSGINIPDSVTSIGKSAFYACRELTSITIPKKVTSISEGTFWACSGLKSITIPDSVTTIGMRAFQACDNLSDVYYGGSESQWKQVSIDSSENGNAPLLNAAVHCNGAGSGTTPVTPAAPVFTDVPEGEWYADPVAWALGGNITNGTSDTTFSPAQDCTQAQILTFLYRAARNSGPASAADMDLAAAWAREKGMIDSTFDGSKKCTRATAVRYIWQAFGKLSAKTSRFNDVPAGADYADAVSWAVANGVTNGTDEAAGLFSPDAVCTRGHIVTFLHRAYVEEARLPVTK